MSEPTAEEHRERRSGDAAHHRAGRSIELRWCLRDLGEPDHAVGGRHPMGSDIFGELVDQLELAHVELARVDPHHPGLELGRPAEAHDDRGRRREQLGLEPESLAAVHQALLEPVRGCPVAVKGTAEGEHEPDGRLVIRTHESILARSGASDAPGRKHERPGGTQASLRSFDPSLTNLS